MIRLTRRPRRAVILVLTLWISIVLSIMALSLAYELRINMRLASQARKQTQALALARAGVGKAVLDLRNDRILAIADPAGGRADALDDVWAQTEDKTDVEIGGGTYTVRVTDEESKLNLNFLTVKSAPVLAYMLHKLTKLDEFDSLQMAVMLVDWQDPDTVSSGGPAANETEYWTRYCREKLADDLPEEWEFRPKNDMFVSLDELLVLPGYTRELLYGDPDAQSKRRRPRKNPRDGEHEDGTPLSLADYVTVQGGRKLNLNTMPPLVMEALLSAILAVPSEAKSMAKKFIDRREQAASSDQNRGALINPQLELQQTGITEQDFGRMNQMLRVDIDSYFFVITSRGTFQGVSKTLQYKVRVDPDVFQVDIKDQESKGRRDEAARIILRDKPQFVIDVAVRVLECSQY